MKDYSELMRLAEAATKCYGAMRVEKDYNGVYLVVGAGSWKILSAWNTPDGKSKDNAEFHAAASPDAVLELIAEVDDLRKGRTDWQAECLKRGFEYVRESDDHYVLADIPEMAELLGMLLGVEVRSKDNDSYGETVSMLQDMADANSDAFHRAYELEKENESLKKDAARYRWTTIEGNWVARMFGKWRAHIGEYGDSNPTDWFDTREEAIDAAMSNKE